MSFKLINNLTGWLVFLIATAVYVLTVEPTASFWDCGEFIACSYKLQVPHPPGAPFFLLVGRVFSMLAGGDVTQVAYWVNMLSVLSSSFTILFLFWTITILARKLVGKTDATLTAGEVAVVIGSGVVGALAYTFSDSFWFSAVEAEVYAMSSLFTALVFWAILKWEAVADEPDSDRWLILIAYLMGLSIGVHLLNLTTIPALAFVYYFRKHQYSLLGVFYTLAISAVILGTIMVGVIPGLPAVAGRFEIFFVNTLGLPFGAGIVFFMVLATAGLVYGVIYSIKKQHHILNTALLSLVFVLIGYSSYGIIVVRSNYDPPIDENDPEDVVRFVSYLKREQYGDRPLLYGPQFTARLIAQENGEKLYRKAEDKYVVYDYKTENKFDPDHYSLLPRIYSPQPNHVNAYKQWVNLPANNRRPSMGDNLSYMFRYQIGFMYWRYFMWNFAGRESDIQNAGWLTPFEDTSRLPERLRESRGRNQFYLLPLLLGLIGLAYQAGRKQRDALIVGLLFFFTGIAIVLYLNQPPIEPRERDYTFAGSFYAFAIWIGLGVMGLWYYARKVLRADMVRALAATGVCLVVPGIMAAEGWDDHDRSNRYHSVDSAKNLLNSCAPNAVLFTGGDNDTFPLWYVQEVEGFRTDVRVCNLSLLNTDWYIDQMKSQAYESEPLPITLTHEDYIQGTNDYLPYYENKRVKNLNLAQYVELVQQRHPAIQAKGNRGMITTLPAKNFYVPVDRESVRAADFLSQEELARVPDRMEWTLNKNNLEKKDLIILDMIVTNNWQRPIYFSTTLAPSSYLNLRDYMRMEGLAYRLLPYRTPGASQGTVAADITFKNVTENFFYRGLDNEDVFYDENYLRFPLNLRNTFYRLASEYMRRDEPGKAKETIDFCLEKMPDESIPYDVYIPQFIPIMLEIGEEERAMQIVETMTERAEEELTYYLSESPRPEQEVQTNMIILQQIAIALSNAKHPDAKQYEDTFLKYYARER